MACIAAWRMRSSSHGLFVGFIVKAMNVLTGSLTTVVRSAAVLSSFASSMFWRAVDVELSGLERRRAGRRGR